MGFIVKNGLIVGFIVKNGLIVSFIVKNGLIIVAKGVNINLKNELIFKILLSK